MASVETHILCFNEQDILPYSLRHYTSFCERVIVHDAFSTDRSREIAKEYGAEVRDWRTDGVNDILAKTLKQEAVMSCRLDWCVVADADELIYFPRGASHTLGSYDANRVAIIKPRGFEMFDDTFPTGPMQIYDYVTMGAEDAKWYAKPVLIAPKRVASLTFSAGAHTAWAMLRDGTAWSDVQTPTQPECYLLHCHQLGGLERIARRYAGQQARHSAINKAKRLGNFEPPDKHARDKREMIMSGIRAVVV